MNQYKGDFRNARGRVAIIASRYNDTVVERLISGAMEAVAASQVEEDDVDLFSVPGAYEIPQLARKLASAGHYVAIVTLGCVIRGETPHFDYVAGECARGISTIAMESEAAMVFGVLTTNTFTQAMERAAEAESNKGYEAMATALEMAEMNRVVTTL